MQRRPSAAVTSLPALAIPLVPRSREMNALLSSESTPHTPTKRAEPLPLFATNTKRYSTDSWNSSNYDGVEDMELEWKPEHLRFLNRTLDNLPSHLLTPFNGSVLPSNLLDKIARRVSEAKGNEWPHSVRATRRKIVELTRLRAQDAHDSSGSDTIAEEGSGPEMPLQQTTNIAPKRPLYRQSSMDFLHPVKPDLKDNPNITRLSRRLQKTDRILPSNVYRPHARSPSPQRRPLSINPSTSSSSTLNSLKGGDRRSTSSMSSTMSDQPMLMAVRRLKRSDTFGPSSFLPRGLKRAPSFGHSSRNSLESAAMSIDFNAKGSDATSSDEEERLRSRKAKRLRRKVPTPTPASPVASPKIDPSSINPLLRPKAMNKSGTGTTSKRTRQSTSTSAPSSMLAKSKAGLQRDPSFLGGELPKPQPNLEPPAVARASKQVRVSRHNPSPSLDLPVPSPMIISPYNLAHIPPATPQSPKPARRNRPTAPLPRASLARRISFGSLIAPQAMTHEATGSNLGSAFQLH